MRDCRTGSCCHGVAGLAPFLFPALVSLLEALEQDSNPQHRIQDLFGREQEQAPAWTGGALDDPSGVALARSRVSNGFRPDPGTYCLSVLFALLTAVPTRLIASLGVRDPV